MTDYPPPPDLAARAERFMADARRFNLVFRCKDCTHVRQDLACSMGFPNAALREREGCYDERGQYAFCKYFELS